ncbi:DUF3168 domain-containing protein [Xinfangfangia sp. D13-10-4-6]|uniref:DUF3168 domain-containing protein n=1 Tax=Pseudogemmobacter hezensis TaxID=2737662 RepID=UPI0015519EEC|nr:DUF3168 domain-containing protein [Pseudogemmobacter hezensis]NPD15366.1 DUF3168 domain-containing protein [Pseudogemmobacter hezensis]
MSYSAAAALQSAVFLQLSASPDLAGVAIHDALPPTPPGLFVLLGPEEVRDASDKSGAGADHRLMISVISNAEGFLAAKRVAVAISDALAAAVPVTDRGRVVSFRFDRAQARRLDEGRIRRIDLTFRARIEF